jgi:hypothetical protein
MTMASAAVMASQGLITGGGPSDPKLQANLRRQGWQPYSMKIGDKYYAYNRLEPLGMIAGLAADFSEISGLAGEEMAPEMENLASAIVASIGKNVTSKTWLKGLSDAVEAMNDPDRYGNKYIQNYAKSLVPSIVNTAERAVDPEVRAAYGMLDSMKSRILGLSSTLPPKRDFWGNVMATGMGGADQTWIEKAYNALSPIYVSEGKDSPIDKELTRMKIGLNMPTRKQTILGVPMEVTPQELDEIIVNMNSVPMVNGKNLKESLDSLVRMPEYKKMTDAMKEQKIRLFVNRAKEAGKMKFVEKHQDIVRIVEDWKQRLQAGGQ